MLSRPEIQVDLRNSGLAGTVRVLVEDKREIRTIVGFASKETAVGNIRNSLQVAVGKSLESLGFSIAGEDSPQSTTLRVVVHAIDFRIIGSIIESAPSGDGSTELNCGPADTLSLISALTSTPVPSADAYIEAMCGDSGTPNVTSIFEGHAEQHKFLFLPSDVEPLINKALSNALEEMLNDQSFLDCLSRT